MAILPAEIILHPSHNPSPNTHTHKHTPLIGFPVLPHFILQSPRVPFKILLVLPL